MSEFEQQKDYQQFHKAYQQASDELPDEAMDAAILSAAHKAVEQENVTGIDTQPVKRAWYVPVSYVAILVISLSVVMKLAFDPVVETPFESERLRKSESMELQMAPSTSMENSAGMSADQSIVDMSEQMSDQVAEFSIRQAPPAAPSRLVAREEKKLGQSAESSRQPEKSLAMQPQAEQRARSLEKQSLREDTRADSAASMPAIAALSSEPVKEVEESLDELASEEQIAAIKQLEQLLQKEMYDELRKKLLEYRKRYPLTLEVEHLPQALLKWEKLNMPEHRKESSPEFISEPEASGVPAVAE